MTSVRTLYTFKLRMFLGPIRRQPAIAAAFVLLALLMLPGAFSFGYSFPALMPSVGPLVEIGALALSAVFALGLLMSPGGGFLLQPAEVEFVAIAPVSVRRFALADVLFQTTLFGISLGFVGIASIGLGVAVRAPVWAFLAPVVSFGVLLFLGLLIIQSLGIARLLRRPWAWPAVGIAFALLVLPAVLRLGFGVPVSYANLPYPTTAAVQVALLPFGGGDWIGVPVLLAWLLFAIAASVLATNHPTLPGLRGTFAFSFTPEAKRVQQEAFLRMFGRLRTTGGAGLYRRSVAGTMMALHRVRMLRDGTVALGLLLSIVFGAITVFSRGVFPFGGLYLALFLPIAAVAQWLVSDRPNLWVLAVSGGRPETFFLGWWMVLGVFAAGAAGVISLLASLPTGHADPAAGAAAVAAGLGASAGSVLCAARFPYQPNEFSMLPLVHILVTGALAGAGLLPVLALAAVLAAQPIVLAAAVLAFLVAGVWLFRAIVAAGTKNPTW